MLPVVSFCIFTRIRKDLEILTTHNYQMAIGRRVVQRSGMSADIPA